MVVLTHFSNSINNFNQLGNLVILILLSYYSFNDAVNMSDCTVPSPIPVTMRSKAQVCNRLISGIVGSKSADSIDVLLLCFFCVLLDSGLCKRLITRPEESYRVLVCLIVCDLETSQTRRPALDLGFALEKKRCYTVE
jgi:hypothetical protein